MKKILLIIAGLFCITLTFGQNNFEWEKVDSVAKSKDEIYSITKMYIGEMWKSAKDVIQNDDKEGGIIMVKGLNIQSKMSTTWKFAYTVKFMFKEKKYRIVIDNVNCESARAGAYNWPLLAVGETYPGYGKTSVSEKKYFDIMTTLKEELQSIVDGYAKYLNNSKLKSSDW